MTTLMQANREWSQRPADQRFTSLPDMLGYMSLVRANSHANVVSNRKIEITPVDNTELRVGVNGTGTFHPTHWAFGQLATLAKAPAGYLRTLPAPMAADCLNWGLYSRDVEEVGTLADSGAEQLRAATGPNYGRIWNSDIITTVMDRVGDGVSGAWKIPGEFGRAVEITKANTTLFASDRDMFIFLADEERRIEIPNRRGGQPGSLARGFFVWNSEVGSSTFGISTFLFDYVCCNRIVWGATDVTEMTIRPSKGAPDRFLEEIMPALKTYAQGSADNITTAIETARRDRLHDVDAFLAKRFSRNIVNQLKGIHQLEEARPIETRWDVVTAMTAKARGIAYQDERIELERAAGDLMAG